MCFAGYISCLALTVSLAACLFSAPRTLLADGNAAIEGSASDNEFAAIEELYNKSAPSGELVERLYRFMEKYPREPRSDRMQMWVALTQQRRKFHNEAIKEFSFLLSEFSTSPLVIQALRAQADSYQAIAKTAEVAACYEKIMAMRPADFARDPRATACYKDALNYLTDAALRKGDADGAVALLMQLPDQIESVTRIVQVYIDAGRHEQALAAARRLPDSQRILAYRLIIRTYAARPGAANLYALFDEIIAKEKPSASIDELIQSLAEAIGSKSTQDRHKITEMIDRQYERLRRWAQFRLCDLDKDSDVQRLIRFAADFHSGADVEQTKMWTGQFYEKAGDASKARETYKRLDDAPAGHFLVAETYYGALAKVKDLPGGREELTNIVKHFYSPVVSAEALTRRSALEDGPMNDTDAAIATLRQIVERFADQGDYPQRALIRLGELFRKQKKFNEAIEAYEKLILDYPQGPHLRESWLQIGYTHEEKGEAGRAVEVFRTVLRKFPRTHEASIAHTRLEDKYNVPDVDVSDR